MGWIRRLDANEWQILYDIPLDPVTSIETATPDDPSFVHGTAEDAQGVLGGVEREIVGGSHAGGGRHPAQGFCDSWWPTLHVGVTAGTVTGYQEEGRRIGTSWKATLPVIGRRRMASVTGDDFTVIYSDMLQPGLAGRSAGHVHRVALRMFRDVKTQGVVSSNPLEDAQKPAEDKYTFST